MNNMISNNKVIVYDFEKQGGLDKTLEMMMDQLHWRDIVTEEKCVYIKLNLSVARPDMFYCANTDQKVLRALLRILKTRTRNIFLVESDLARGEEKGGLYGGGTAEDMFKSNGIEDIAKEFGVKTMSLSGQELEYNLNPLLEDFGFPKCLIDEQKVFITMPLIKTHALTQFTGALKNQWGCVPRWDRVLLHKNLDELLVLCNKLIKPDLVIMGGTYAMEGRGPTSGEPRKFPVLIGSRKAASADAVATSLIGLKPENIKHIALADSDILGTTDVNQIEILGDYEELITQFKPATLDWALRAMNYLTRYKFFVYKILQNRRIFEICKYVVNLFRKLKIVR